MEVKPIPGLEHLPYAEVWFHSLDDTRWREASNAARELGKSGLEAWTTTRTPEVAELLREHGYSEERRYVVSELDVAAAPDPGVPAFEVTTLAERPDLLLALYELARVVYADQPGRAETRVNMSWFEWGLRAHPPEAYFIAVDGDAVLGFGYLERDGMEWRNGFLGVARAVRGRGVAGALKRAQINWAKHHSVARLTTANETRLEGLLALNQRLGYVPVYEEIVLRGPLAPA